MAMNHKRLSEDEITILRLMRNHPEMEPWRPVDIMRSTGMAYHRAWRATNALQFRGYVERDRYRAVKPCWVKLTTDHRAEISTLLGIQEEPEPVVEESGFFATIRKLIKGDHNDGSAGSRAHQR